MIELVRRFSEENNLLDNKELYVVGLSGGADSVALFLLLSEMGFRIHAAHCNFHLRGSESNRDEAFCVDLCERMGVELHLAHFDTKEYAALHKVSIEMAARELRYAYFEQLRRDLGAAAICVAHHRDDSVETVLMNLVRGCGLRGLCGIQPRYGYVIRPLLCVSRQEIEAFLASRGQAYVTDSSNLEDDVLRNKVRLHLIPLLKTLNLSVVQAVQHAAENLNEARLTLDAFLEGIKDKNSFKMSELSKYGSSEFVIFEWLKNYGFNGTQVRQILRAEQGSLYTSSKGYDVLVDRGELLLEPSLKPMKPVRIPETGVYVVDANVKVSVRTKGAVVSKTADCATLDASKVMFPLTVRRTEPGDKMVPFGMKGYRLLSDMMTDVKMSRFEKRRQLVVVDATGKVIWLVGMRTDNRCRVEPSTKQVLEIKVNSENI